MRYKFLGYIFIIVVFSATISLLYYQQTTGGGNYYMDSAHRTSNTLKDLRRTFEIKYPRNYQLLPAELDEIGIIAIPKEFYPNTNFIDAKVFVSMFEKSTMADCGTYGDKKLTDYRKINSVDFYTAEFMGAAAGNQYESKVYRTIRGSACYEIVLTLHTGNIGNYPEGEVEEVDKDDAWKRLDNILETFTFTK